MVWNHQLGDYKQPFSLNWGLRAWFLGADKGRAPLDSQFFAFFSGRLVKKDVFCETPKNLTVIRDDTVIILEN